MPETLWDQSHPGIYIDGDPTFFAGASLALNELRGKPIGKDLVSLLSKRCGIVNVKVLITKAPGTLTESAGKTAAKPTGLAALRSEKTLPGTTIQLPGKGSGSIAAFNPDAEAEYTALVGISTPVYVALGHELCHSLHHLSGNIRLGAGADLATRFKAMYLQEEAHTVGLGPYAKTRISENAIRKENGLPLRTYYSAPGDCDALPSLGGTV
jgi:hypothetical protein